MQRLPNLVAIHSARTPSTVLRSEQPCESCVIRSVPSTISLLDHPHPFPALELHTRPQFKFTIHPLIVKFIIFPSDDARDQLRRFFANLSERACFCQFLPSVPIGLRTAVLYTPLIHSQCQVYLHIYHRTFHSYLTFNTG